MIEPDTINAHLIGTIDKKALMDLLRKWRRESTNPIEAVLIRDIQDHVRSGELDG